MIDYLARRIRADKLESSVDEIRIRQVQGGGHKARHIDLRAGPEGDAVGIDQEDPAVGLQLAQNARGVTAGHTIEYGAGRRLLDKPGGLALGNGEALPVDDRTRGIGDRKGAPVLGKTHPASGHRRRNGQRLHPTCKAGCHCNP